jgi:hypothetical protein
VSLYEYFQSSLSPTFHQSVIRTLQGERVHDMTSHEAVPSLILGDPAVLSAVAQMLGDSAEPDPCRHVHLNPSPEHGAWHVDDYCGSPWPVGEFAILCYFPQDTPLEMGPTAIRIDGCEIRASGPAGTCLLMRHTVEHRATANTSGRQRYMLKYLFRSGAMDPPGKAA